MRLILSLGSYFVLNHGNGITKTPKQLFCIRVVYISHVFKIIFVFCFRGKTENAIQESRYRAGAHARGLAVQNSCHVSRNNPHPYRIVFPFQNGDRVRTVLSEQLTAVERKP